MPEAFTVAVPATSANLGPGFDAIGLALDLFVRARVRPASAFAISYAATAHRPTNDGFTREILRAMERVRGVSTPPEIEIQIENAIPLGKGLGASAAGAVLGAVIGAQLCDAPSPVEALARPVCELEGHPDNALPALLGGIVVAAMQDDASPAYLRFEPPSGLRAVVAVPNIVLPTAAARALLPHAYERADAIFNVQRAALLAASLASGNLAALRVATADRFHQPYRAPLVPGFAEMLAFERPGLLSVTLSGAGPSVLALLDEQADAPAIGEEMRLTFARQGIASEILVLNVLAGRLDSSRTGAPKREKPVLMSVTSTEYQLSTEPKLKAFIRDMLVKVGVDADPAATVAEVLTAADMRGIESHGIARLESYYVSRLRAGKLKAKPNVQVVRETESSILLDADNGLGHPAGKLAMERVIEKARRHGSAFGAVRNSNHYGIAGYYAMMALEHDMIGISSTNSVRYGAPTFGKDILLGTNPLAFAIPTREEPAFVLDFATTTVPRGKLEVYQRKEKPLNPGWAIDTEGHQTLDAVAAMKGALLPLGGFGIDNGGHKGYGLGLLVDILCGVLSGGAFGTELPLPSDGPLPGKISHFFGAIRVDAFRDADAFKCDMDRELRMFKDSQKTPGQERIYVAGEIEHEKTSHAREEGVPVHVKVWSGLERLAQGSTFRSPFPAKYFFGGRKERASQDHPGTPFSFKGGWMMKTRSNRRMVHVSVGSPAGTYSVSNASFFRYIVRLLDVDLPLLPLDRDALSLLAAIPDASLEEEELSGHGWRVVPAASLEDWPVLEATPQRLRSALQTARRILWENATPVGISAREIVALEEELDNVLSILARAEAAGHSVNVSYVS